MFKFPQTHFWLDNKKKLLHHGDMVFCSSDLKRNDYTPDKVTFPQEDPPNPGGGVKESHQSMRLMLWSLLKPAQESESDTVLIDV